MASRNLYLDTDNDTDGRSLSRQSRSGSRNNIIVARRNGNASNNGMLEGMESSPNVNGHDENNDERHSPVESDKEPVEEIHSDPDDVEEDASYAYSMDYGEFESDTETPRQEKNDKSKGSKSIKLRVKEPSRRLPTSRWRTMNVFDDDEKQTPKNSKKKSGSKSRKKSSSSKENAVKPQYMESSTESEDEDDRKLDRNTLPAGELSSEYWQIQKLIKFVKIGNQTATLIALCALNDFDMRSEICQMAVRDVNGLRVLTNMLRTDHDKCKIATMKLLSPLTDKSKYNRRELVRFGAMHSLVEHIALSDNRDVVGWAATIIANMSQCSLARNILKQNDGIRKLVNLLDFEENDKLRMSYPKRMYHGLDKEVLAKNLSVAKSASRALWSCCRSSQRCRVAVLKTGGVPYLAKLVMLESEEILVPVTGLIQECCVEKNFRVAVQHTNIIKYIVSHLTRDNLELKTYGALTIFKVSSNFCIRILIGKTRLRSHVRKQL